jgi:hypothetical protein
MAYVIYTDAHAAAYFVFNVIDFFRLKFDGLCGAFVRTDCICVDSIAPWFMSTMACHARGLAIMSSRTQHRSGSTSLRLCVRKLTLKICDFVDISNTLWRSQQCSGASP